MKKISAQVSLYPLRQVSIGPAIRSAVRVFQDSGLEIRTGAMSTLIWGEEQEVFSSLQKAFHESTASGDAVMIVTFSNACPSPKEP